MSDSTAVAMDGRTITISEGTEVVGAQYQGKDIEEVRIPEGVHRIERGAF